MKEVNKYTRTLPNKKVDNNARPSGKKTTIKDNITPENKRSLIRENESADLLAKHGYEIEQNPKVAGNKNPDYKVNNQIYDNYAPSGSKARNIASEIEKKVFKEQTKRIILNLDDSFVDINAMKLQLKQFPINGLEEVIAIKNGKIMYILP